MKANLHELAAAVELATLQAGERWVVQVHENDSYSERGRVYLELATDGHGEAALGAAILERVRKFGR